MEDKLNRAVKKTKASIAEPVDTTESDMDEDVCMQDMESDEAYTSLYDKDEAVMKECQDEAAAKNLHRGVGFHPIWPSSFSSFR
jgi:hypothetical protein